MRRIFRLLIIIPALTLLWGYANAVGVTDRVTQAAGLPDMDSWKLPGVDRLLDANDVVEEQKQAIREEAQRRALQALRKEVAKRYGPEAAANIPADLTTAEIKRIVTSGLAPEVLAQIANIEVPGAPKPGGDPKDPGPGGGTGSGTVVNATITNGTAKDFNRARSLLGTLDVKGKAPMTGYSRDEFGTEWSDAVGNFPWSRNGCDTRNDVLRRDLVKKSFDSGSDCDVARGVLPYEPYTGAKNYRFDAEDGEYATDLDIEHIVALGAAFATGASTWTEEKRSLIANDPINLFAADPSSNRQKGDADAATWLPSNKAFRCSYVSRQIFVKAKYGLWVTPAEKAAMERVLDGCPK